MIKKTFTFFQVLLLIAIFFSCERGSNIRKSRNPYTGQTEGWAKVFDDDEALARDRAIDDAKLKLVEKIIGKQIMGIDVMENYRIVKNMVEAKT